MPRRRKSRTARSDPTPEALRTVLAFLNTQDLRSESDELDSAAALGAWLARHSLAAADAEVSEDDWKEARAVRAALRSLLYAHGGGAVDAKAVKLVNRTVDELRYRLRFDRDGAPHADLVVESGWRGGRARVFEALVHAQSDDRWSRLKLCHEPSCRLAFYDASNNRSAKWCRARRCGGRLYSLAYRKRYPKTDDWSGYF